MVIHLATSNYEVGPTVRKKVLAGLDPQLKEVGDGGPKKGPAGRSR